MAILGSIDEMLKCVLLFTLSIESLSDILNATIQMKAKVQNVPVVLFIMMYMYKSYQLLSQFKSYSVTIQMKATECWFFSGNGFCCSC